MLDACFAGRWNLLASLLWLGGIVFLGTGREAAAANPPLTFERDIRSIFRAHCLDCHGAAESIEGNLDLRLVRFMQKGGDSGAAIVSGKPHESLLIERIKSGDMPPGEGKVSAAELKQLEDWIAAGAPTARPEPEKLGPGLPILPEEREWWSFRPIVRPEVAVHPKESRVRTPVDALLLTAMPKGLSFSEDADRLTQALRVSFDLTGLPPSQERLQQFLNDQSEDAYSRLVDELLASPHYGERWGRHWLDVAGYADSEGRTNSDAVRNWAFRYRDYVIRSFNSGKPFDQFLHEQIAGDELAGPIKGDLTPEQIELLTATGFLRMAADGTGSGDNSEEARNLVIADTIQIVSSSLLGLSVACAQCHDHRYDPISHTDYFALRAVFEPALDWKKWRVPNARNVSLYTKADREAAAAVEEEAKAVLKTKSEKQQVYLAEALTKELEKHEEPLRTELRKAYETVVKDRTPEQVALLKKYPSVNIHPGVLYQYNQKAADDLKTFDEEVAKIRARKPAEEFIRVLAEPAGKPPETHLFYRGDYRQPKQVVSPAAMAVLCSEENFITFPEKDPSLPTSGRRLAFAKWLTSSANPITARVLANRVWLHHFGRGLVDTPADFGKLGAKPTHPELLDWLASELMTNGWDLKKFHRLIVLSTAYRQSSVRDAQKAAIDDINEYYWRRNVVRLDAEILRDRVLAASGQLDLTQFGPAIPVKEDKDGQPVVEGTVHRRSLYIQQRRSQPIPMLQAFDAPVMTVNCERRPSSTVATQSLMLMNSPFALDQSLVLANRILKEKTSLLSKEQIASLPKIPLPQTARWLHGYGGVDESAPQKVRFTAFPHFEKGSWQGSAARPDPKIGWAFLNATGGHTGNNPDFAPIRRWIAPVAGKVKITGTLNHPSPNGDGVRGRVVTGQGGTLKEWVALGKKVETNLGEFSVTSGETVDFVTDCQKDVNADSFTWTVTITMTLTDGSEIVTTSEEGFSGPTRSSTQLTADHIAQAWLLAYCRLPSQEELNLGVSFLNRQITEMNVRSPKLPSGVSASQQALANLCQALLTSNEFLYIE